MKVHINKQSKAQKQDVVVYVFAVSEGQLTDSNYFNLDNNSVKYIQKRANQKINLFYLPDENMDILVQLVELKEQEAYLIAEDFRKAGNKVWPKIKSLKAEKISVFSAINEHWMLAWTEGLALGSYSFQKYLTGEKQAEEIKIDLINDKLTVNQVRRLNITIDATFIARDLVNEPGSVLNAEELANRIVALGKESGFKTEVFNQAKIESLKMGGLLAVNAGSLDAPTFSVMEWKPKEFKNKKPIVLVGKGLVFDTGGLSLKPTSASMDQMKCDMSGAAAVIGTLYAISKMELPLHIIGLIPSTDNRPGQNAYYPGDVIKMYDGSTVEVLNTDAEGRMILADALAYAKKYKPELTINLATLTGSAAIATGTNASVAFFKTNDEVKKSIIESGFDVFERLVAFPMWDDYFESLKSDIADMKNIGGREAGAITAAKFLEKFTDYPFVHLDIAGTAFSFKGSKYNPNGATGVGVRLLTNYFSQRVNEE